jgi:hypothetical protein
MFKHASSNLKFYIDEEKQALNAPTSPQRLKAFSKMYVGGSDLGITVEQETSHGAVYNSHFISNA